MEADTLALLTAFMAGLLGSGHCFGMCGGIAGTFGALASTGDRRRPLLPALVFNTGRMSSYAILGALMALLLGGTGDILNVPHWARLLRLATAAMILLIGLRFLFNAAFLDRIERLGAGVWRKVQPLAIRMSAKPGPASRFLLGLCWGLLPCGLVYTMLLTAAAQGRPASGAAVMVAFGLGTLPSMLGVAWAAPVLHAFLEDRTVRRLIGLSLVILALWALMMIGRVPLSSGMH